MNTSTTHSTDNTDEAQFLAPETHQKATAVKRLPIGQFRWAVDRLNWVRRDLGGSTKAEWLNADVPKRLAEPIALLAAAMLEVHPRFTVDLARATEAIFVAHEHINRWKAEHERIAAGSNWQDQGKPRISAAIAQGLFCGRLPAVAAPSTARG